MGERGGQGRGQGSALAAAAKAGARQPGARTARRALSFRRMLADCTSRRRRGRDAQQQCYSRTWPARSTLLFQNQPWAPFLLSSRKRDEVFDGHRGRAEGPLGRGDQVRRHHYQAAGCCGVLAQDGTRKVQGPLVLGLRLAEASSHIFSHPAGRSLGGLDVRTDLSGVSRELGALPHASRGECASSSTMWWYLWRGRDGAGDTAVPDVNGRLGDPAGGGFAPGAAREAATVSEGTVRIASDFGLQLKLSLGKTEAVVSWVGPGSRPIRRRLMSLSTNRQRCRFGLWQRTSGQCGSCRLIVTWGRSLRLELAWERSHRVPTLDRRRRMRCHHDSWAMRASTTPARWPRPVWPRGVCSRRGRGTFLRVPSCSG